MGACDVHVLTDMEIQSDILGSERSDRRCNVPICGILSEMADSHVKDGVPAPLGVATTREQVLRDLTNIGCSTMWVFIGA